jgi:predicted nucleic acid-binding protein
MKRILLDTNIVLDVLLDRHPHVEASLAVWAAVEADLSQGLLAGHAVTTIHYLLRKEMGNAKATRVVSAILRIFGVAAVDSGVLHAALQLPFADFEDAVTASAARMAGCDCIVTRDPKGFRSSPVRCLTPEAVIPLFIKS